MTDKTVDKAKGGVKEAAGAVTGDRDLERRGRAEQAKGEIKKAADRVADTLRDVKESASGGEPRR